jgi:hypothetical protein
MALLSSRTVRACAQSRLFAQQLCCQRRLLQARSDGLHRTPPTRLRCPDRSQVSLGRAFGRAGAARCSQLVLASARSPAASGSGRSTATAASANAAAGAPPSWEVRMLYDGDCPL